MPSAELSDSAGEPEVGLGAMTLKGGTYLALRHALEILLGLVGMPIIARSIGPGSYGLWTAALQVFLFGRRVSGMGLDVYLMRKEGTPDPRTYHQAFTLLAILGFIGAGVFVAIFPAIDQWMKLDGLKHVTLAYMVGLPLAVTTVVPLAILERRLDYRRAATIELAGRVAFYGIAIPLAYAQFGVWAPVLGFWGQQVGLALSLYAASGYRPRVYFNPLMAREMLTYGFRYSCSTWIWNLRDLVNPLVVARYAGPAAVGYVGLAERITIAVSFAKTAAWRLSLVVLGRLQGDRARLCRAVSRGLRLQLVAISPPLLALGLVLPLLLPWALGERWAPVARIYPFIAAGCIVNSMFTLQSSSLYVLDLTRAATKFNTLHIVLFAAVTALSVPHLGYLGYGIGELVALISYVLLDRYFKRLIGSVDYGSSPAIAFAVVLGLFWIFGGWPLMVPLLFLGLSPKTWRFARGFGPKVLAGLNGSWSAR
jgi:PST family polysaccharide transporter